MAAKVTPIDLWSIKIKITGPTKSVLEVDGYFSTEIKNQICNAIHGNSGGSSDIEILRRIAERGLKYYQTAMDGTGVDLFQHMLDEIARCATPS